MLNFGHFAVATGNIYILVDRTRKQGMILINYLQIFSWERSIKYNWREFYVQSFKKKLVNWSISFPTKNRAIVDIDRRRNKLKFQSQDEEVEKINANRHKKKNLRYFCVNFVFVNVFKSNKSEKFIECLNSDSFFQCF